jgi:hypothetical protein
MITAVRTWARECWPAWGVGGILALLAVFVGAPVLVPLVVPMSHFYELRSVTVKDAMPGTSPKIIVDRVIQRDFRGHFEVEVMRAEGAEFVSYWECGPHVSDWRTYRAEVVLPPELDLDWWMGIPPNRECKLPAGTYKVLTTIYARGPLGAVMSTSAESNVFTVSADATEIPPISIPDATAHWISDRQFDITAPAFYWTDTCPSIWVTWLIQTRRGVSIPVTTHAVAGPFAAQGEMPSRYRIAIKPMVGPALQLRATIPDGVSAADVVLVSVVDVVPDNEPCASGWTGTMQVFRLEIKPLVAP